MRGVGRGGEGRGAKARGRKYAPTGEHKLSLMGVWQGGKESGREGWGTGRRGGEGSTPPLAITGSH